MKFGLESLPEIVNYKNSGVDEIENLNLEELENEIDGLLREAGRFYYKDDKTNTILRRFSKLTFLANKTEEIYDNDTGYSDEEVKKVLKEHLTRFKYPIMDKIREWYKIKYNPELEFEGKLLEQLGFRPCSNCHKNIYEIDNKEPFEAEGNWSDQSNIDIIFKDYPNLN